MSKLYNKGYISPLAALAKINFPFARALHGYFYPIDDELLKKEYLLKSSELNQFLSGFQPLLSMKKDFVDTFKPYKRDGAYVQDLKQPLNGLANIGKGILTLALVPFLFIGISGLAIYQLGLRKKHLNRNHKLGGALLRIGVNCASWALHGVTNTLRGITQIVFAPAVLIKVALRKIITAFSAKPLPFKERPGVVKLVKAIEKQPSGEAMLKIEDEDEKQAIIRNTTMMYAALYRKYKKAVKRDETPNVSSEVDNLPLKGVGRYNDLKKYAEFFSKAKPEVNPGEKSSHRPAIPR